ncbi:MAG: TIGR00730 family Rossman fold protein [Pseudomonadota bacterium]
MTTSICIFCGSQHGSDRRYRAAAMRLGTLAGAAGLKLVYGGGQVGLMGAAADAAMAAGGQVVGLIPERLLKREVGHRAITELVVTRDMFDRKEQMIARSDAFVILPGGLGTLDELVDVLTLAQLGYHNKPIILVNMDGFWDPFLQLVDHVISHGFAAPNVRDLYRTVASVEEVLPALGVGERQAALRAAAAD